VRDYIDVFDITATTQFREVTNSLTNGSSSKDIGDEVISQTQFQRKATAKTCR
jgi:hypothetical protein